MIGLNTDVLIVGKLMARTKENSEIMKHGLSICEIAKILKCTPQNVSHIIRKSIKKLRKIVEINNMREFLEK